MFREHSSNIFNLNKKKDGHTNAKLEKLYFVCDRKRNFLKCCVVYLNENRTEIESATISRVELTERKREKGCKRDSESRFKTEKTNNVRDETFLPFFY